MSTSRRSLQVGGKLHCDGTFDIECSDWDRFNCAATHWHNDYGVPFTKIWRTPEELVTYLLARGGTWWAHAGGIYDFLLVAEVMRRAGVKATISLSQHRISSITASGLTLRDSFALIPMPLAEAAELVGRTAHRWPWKCECGRACGGYCRIPKWQDPDVDEHVVADVELLWDVMHALARHATAHGYQLRGTIAGTAWATARDALGIPDADLPASVWKRLKQADKGGRNIVGRAAARGPGTHWDLVSSYATSLARTALPVGHMAELGERRAGLAFHNGAGGVYSVRVKVPEMPFPPLPWRHGGRVAYPFGEFAGTWTAPELEAAIERGATIERFHWGIVWDDQAVLFGGLMRDWFAVRAKVGKQTPLGRWQNELMKSLTGKFAEVPERDIVTMNPHEVIVCLGRGACAEGCTGRCGAFRQLDRWGQIFTRTVYRQASSGHLVWHAYLTASARLAQLRGIERVGYDRFVYGATDSAWTLGREAPGERGAAMGDWELKHAWRDWECVAVHHYAFTREGVKEQKAAGASKLTRQEWERGEAERERGVSTFLGAAREGRGLFRKRVERWTMPRRDDPDRWLGDRKLDPVTGLTYPVSAEVHRERVRSEQQRKQEARVAHSSEGRGRA
jgi:hypothetical protein